MNDKRLRFVWIILLFVVFIGLNTSTVWKWMYPVYYKQEIKRAAEKYQVDPYLILAIIQIESKFQSQRVSHKGAIGMMQIMPDTAKWILEQSGASVSLDQLAHPTMNIEIGSWYLSFLEKKYRGNMIAVIAAYNAGPGSVDNWLKNDVWNGTYDDLTSIPFGETRHYIERVLYFYGRYQAIYHDEFS